jgi:hypothetical protein
MWFGVSLLYKAVHRKPEGLEDLWEESVILVEAESAEAARAIAMEHGQAHEVEYDVAGGDSVRWTFDSIVDLFEITDTPIGSGTEVFSRYLKEAEVTSLRTPFEK